MSAPTEPGPLLFARYAFMPNQLGYCGSSDNRALFDYATSSIVDGGLLDLERQFEGAYPYLQLISAANGIRDPLDRRVVEAYWVGNELLKRVDLGALYRSLESRFAGRMSRKSFAWLAGKVPAGARPHHSFHVFEVYPRAGTARGGLSDNLLETVENCRVRWGRVAEVSGAELVVDMTPIELNEGHLCLGRRRLERVRRSWEGRGFVDGAAAGDWISVHWGWACDVLSGAQLRSLVRYTTHHLALMNDTL